MRYRMRRNALVLFVVGLLVFPSAVSFFGSSRTDAKGPRRFPSTEVVRDRGFHGRVFEMSQDYPQTPFTPRERGQWMDIDFHQYKQQYAYALLAYCLEGNWDVGFRGQNNGTRTWYHAPYMHPLPKGREYINGLTYELPSLSRKLGPKQEREVQNWAVAMYNRPGGYAVGKYWEGGKPSMKPVRFERGTVAFKLLFTEATPQEVPELTKAPIVLASIYTKPLKDGPAPPRKIQCLRLLQIDIMARDPRAEPNAPGNNGDGSGWVFVSFQFNGTAPQRPVKKMPPWFSQVRLLGLMWGNDQKVNVPNAKLSQTWLNNDVFLPRGHEYFGWSGRLNGPVDNPKSSCLSCHSTAQTPHIDQAIPPDGVKEGSLDWMRWFRTLPPGVPFTLDGKSMDYSLQLAKGVRNYCRQYACGPLPTPMPLGPQPKYDRDR